jgi:tRNA pseudouridine38-40 synthase
MTRVRLTLAYNGAPFYGFAKQEGIPTVAGELTETLEKILNHEVELTAAGRTDTGVHAWGQVVNFDTKKTAKALANISFHDDSDENYPGELPGLMRALNKLLAPNIVIREASVASKDFSARHSAKSRTYKYTVLNSPIADPFIAHTSWHVEPPLELAAMRLACDPVVGNHDFAAFCKQSENPNATTTRRVLSAEWNEVGENILQFEITAYAFCHNMVRSLVGTMVDMGLGRLKAGEMAAIIRSKKRENAGTVAPPHGLCLWNVEY